MNRIFGRATELFLAASELDSPQLQAAFLDQACAGDRALRDEVERLLSVSRRAEHVADQGASTPSAQPGPAVDATADHQTASERPGMHVGPYKLLEAIGEGGMGTVWVAEQTRPMRRKVALKLVKLGMDSRHVLARFEAERQALALMDHPNIAKVYDGGMTDQGRPYFVMEYVKGIPLTQYCDDARLPLRDRLALFVSVCQAVQHAHQKGIIHRDLKPTNILVCLYDGQPVPKVIDFGLAKAMHQPLTEQTLHTAHGFMVGTPLYMSPEQATFNNLDVDTRTDIYSLGVILYELLTGSTPFHQHQFQQAALDEMLRLIKEVEPPKPSTRLSGSASLPSIAAQRGIDPAQLGRTIKGDLDWIVMKTLEKERSRRYETANGLARDIERFLHDEPVEACPPSRWYRWRKFASKNRGALRSAAAIGALLVSGICVSSGQAIRATRAEGHARELLISEAKARTRAEANEKKATQLAISERAAKEDQARQRHAAEAANERAMKALESFTDELMGNLFASKKHFSDPEKAVLRQALEQWNAFAESAGTSAEGRRLRATGLYRVADLQSRLGLNTEAKANFQSASKLFQPLIEVWPDDTMLHTMHCDANTGLAHIEDLEGYEVEAITRMRKVIAEYETLHETHPDEPRLQGNLARSLLNLFILSQERLTVEERESLARQAMALYEKLVATSDATMEDRLYLTSCYNDLGTLAIEQQNLEGARNWITRALAGREQLAKEFPENWEILEYMARPISNLAAIEYLHGNVDRGIKLDWRCMDVLRQVVAAAPGVSSNRYHLGKESHDFASQLLTVGQNDDALRVVDEAIATLEIPVTDEMDAARFQDLRQRLEEARALTLVRLGRAAEAVELSDRLIRQPGWESGDLYNFACVLSLATAIGGEESQSYADRAIAALRQSIEAGFTDAAHMRVDGDLDSIRDHEDFDDSLALATELAAKLDAADHAGQAGKWDIAAERYQELIDRWPSNHDYWYNQAHILAILGDRERYRHHCLAMVDRFGEYTHPTLAERTSKAIMLLAEVDVNHPLAVKLSEVAVSETAGDTYIRYYLFSRGLAAFRGGDFDKAADYSRRSLQAQGRMGYSDVFSNLLLAMASAKAGRDSDATAAWRAARSKISDDIPPLDSPDLSEGWRDVILIHLLLSECRTALGEDHVKEVNNVEFDHSYAYLLEGRYADAERELRKRLPHRTSVGDTWLTRARIGECLLRQGKYDEGVAMLGGVWKEKLQMMPDAPDAALLLAAWDVSAAKTPEHSEPRGEGLEFNGSSDYVLLPTVYFDGNPPWTLEAIVNLEEVDQAPGGWTSLVSAADFASISLGTNQRRWALDLHAASHDFMAWTDNYRTAFAQQPPPLSVWQHVAGVWDGHELRLYIDGQLQQTVPGVDRCARLSESPLLIGADPQDIFVLRVAHGFLHGRIRCARVSRAAEYTESFPKPEQLKSTPGTMGLYDFTIDTGQYAIDQSRHGNHGIIVGARFVRGE